MVVRLSATSMNYVMHLMEQKEVHRRSNCSLKKSHMGPNLVTRCSIGGTCWVFLAKSTNISSINTVFYCLAIPSIPLLNYQTQIWRRTTYLAYTKIFVHGFAKTSCWSRLVGLRCILNQKYLKISAKIIRTKSLMLSGVAIYHEFL